MSSGQYFLSSRNFEKDPFSQILEPTEMSLSDPKQYFNGITNFASTSAAIVGASLLNLASGGALPHTPGAGSSVGSPLMIPEQRSSPTIKLISMRPRSNLAVKLLGPGDPKVQDLLKESFAATSDR
jgi:hypothetical protein